MTQDQVLGMGDRPKNDGGVLGVTSACLHV